MAISHRNKDSKMQKRREQGRCIPMAVLILSGLMVQGCGYHAVYATQGSTSAVANELNQVGIDSIPNREGQVLRNDLIDRLYGKGRPTSVNYHLSVKINIGSEDLGTLADSTTVLVGINTDANYTLTDTAGHQVLSGHAHSATSYDKLNNQYGTLASHDSAVDRTLHEVGEQITNRLGLYFAEKDSSTSTVPATKAP
ncbi:MAG: hypothetical protein JO126_02095 [Alphaproteobacteria bacterium]|nr:hypothetical protein [Alphaproteobacteria bacterium]MBV8548230.1 hypothetical protein [Alphaproteobacteria bacterium]